jgi:hypothetical protein
MFGTETLVDDSFSIDNESNTNASRCFPPPSDNILSVSVGNGVVNDDFNVSLRWAGWSLFRFLIPFFL